VTELARFAACGPGSRSSTEEERMTEQRPDTDDRREPGGTPTAGRGDLTDRPVTPGDDAPASAVPGAYEADDDEQERGRVVKPGN
jgi:hypothetical protein